MSRITPISSKEFERVLLVVGCEFVRQESSHRVYWRSDLVRPIIVPVRKTLPVFIIKNNLRLLSLSNEQYLNILRSL